MSNFFHPLMHDNFQEIDFKSLITFLKKKPILTQNKKVKKFEEEWSKWLGTKYSIFVNSGSSANFLSILALATLNKADKRNEIIVPSLTWISDIVSVIKNGFKPIFVDINYKNLSMNIDQVKSKINKKTFGIFLTHAQGFNGLNEELLKIVKRKKIFLIEDVCESHGAKFNNKKVGTFGQISNFSFYYAHHMTTIEGGMICTNNKKIYELSKILRSHGMAREAKNKKYQNQLIKKYKSLSPQFIFLHPTLNFRNNEIGAVIGISQLKNLDKNNRLRTKNFKIFLKYLDPKKYWVNYDLSGSCNYAFPIILNTNNIKKRDLFENCLKKNKIEFRRGNAGGGNQLRQPYLKKYRKKLKIENFKNTEHMHFYGFYIGNYPELKKRDVDFICKIINSA